MENIETKQSLVLRALDWAHITLCVLGVVFILLLGRVTLYSKALLIEPNSISFGEWDAGDKVITDQDSTIKKR